jgi:hypothetical protein
MRKTSNFNVVNCYIVAALAFCNGKHLCTFPFIDMFEFELEITKSFLKKIVFVTDKDYDL